MDTPVQATSYASTSAPSPSRLPRRSRLGTVSARPPADVHISGTPPLSPLPSLSERSSTFDSTVFGAAEVSDPHPRDFESGPSCPSLSRHREDDQGGSSRRNQGTMTLRSIKVASQARASTGGDENNRRRRKKWLVLVTPPSVLPHDPPPAAASAFASGYGASGRYEGGILLPLQASLPSQVSLIAREYGLPSIAGICLYLHLPQTPTTAATASTPGPAEWPFPSPALSVKPPSSAYTPRITEESWTVLWSDYFDMSEAAEEMPSAGGLPIAGRIEFDFDPRRAKWLDEWVALPRATSESLSSAPPLSPAFDLHNSGLPRFGTSRSYIRPVTPAMSDARVSELSATDFECVGSAQGSLPPSRVVSPTTPRMSTPRSSFESHHRPLSLLSETSSMLSRTATGKTSRASLAAALPDDAEIDTPRRPAMRRASGTKPVVNDSGFADGVSSSASFARSGPPEPSPIVLDSAGGSFAFPRPAPRTSPTPSRSPVTPPPNLPLPLTPSVPPPPPVETDWTAQLDRLREISETSLLDGVDHPSQFGSVDVSDSFAELLRGIVSETKAERVDLPPRVEQDYASGLYPPRGLYGLKQPAVSVPVIVSNEAQVHNTGTAASPAPIASTAQPTYPSLVLYPPVYPHFDLYPQPAGAVKALFATDAEVPDGHVPSIVAGVSSCSVRSSSPAPPDLSDLVEDDPFASSSRNASGGLGDEGKGTEERDDAHVEDDLLDSYAFDGRPLSSITEVTETDQGSGQSSPARSEQLKVAGGSFGELELTEEIEQPFEGNAVVAHDALSCSATIDQPQFLYSSPTASLEPFLSSEPDGLLNASPSSPLPSPTIRPARAIVTPSPISPPRPDSPATSADETTQQLDYTLEVTETLSSTLDYSGSTDTPYIVSSGLQAALGLDDSPQLGPTIFPTDEIDSDDSQSDYESPYVVRHASIRVDRDDERDPGDECQTFDYLTSPTQGPPSPLLFAFSPLSQSTDLLDALALFILEAQTQSVDRRGRFTIALGSGDLPKLLALALIDDERIEWDKWEVFFAVQSVAPDERISHRYIDELFSHVPVCSGRLHVLSKGITESSGCVGDYEQQLARAFPDASDEDLPKFDLILLDGQDADVVPQLTKASSSNWITSVPTSSTLSFALPLFSSARRLAYIVTSTSSSSTSLSSLLSWAVPHEQAQREDGATGLPPGRVVLTGSQHPVVVFAEELVATGVDYPRARFWDGDDEHEGDEAEGRE